MWWKCVGVECAQPNYVVLVWIGIGLWEGLSEWVEAVVTAHTYTYQKL